EAPAVSGFYMAAAHLQHAPRRADLLRDSIPHCASRLRAAGADARQTAQTMCNMLWAQTALDCLSPEDFAAAYGLVADAHAEKGGAFFRARRGSSRSKSAAEVLPEQGLAQVYQSAVHLGIKTGAAVEDLISSPALLAAAASAWRRNGASVSLFHEQVMGVLRRMGVPFELEHRPDHGLFSIDLAIRVEGKRRLAVEVDGPLHFAQTAPYRELAHTALRNRLLRHHGWEVVSLPHREWRELRSEAQRQDYLRRKVVDRMAA
ncbi:hypothetical protein H632_c1084p0, partial [Helicosporidium sp. ATCC 50920]